MNLLNLYFTPFAAVLVVMAAWFSKPDPMEKYLSFGILALSLGVSYWFSKHTYRYVGWANRLKILQVWLTYLWSAILVYLLMPFCAPIWLLLTLPPVGSALYQGRGATVLTGVVSGLTVLAAYWLNARRFGMPLEGIALAQGVMHATFIPVLGLFVHALAQTALQMRDIRSRPYCERACCGGLDNWRIPGTLVWTLYKEGPGPGGPGKDVPLSNFLWIS